MSSTPDRHTHALLPPSASGRWMACAPSMAYVRALIEAKIIRKRKSGPAAEKGTRIHTWGEQFIKWIRAGKKTDGVKGDKDELEQAKAYAQYCVEMLEELDELYGVVAFGIEDRAVVDAKYCWGHRDFWVLTKRKLHVLDLKTGFEEVNPDSSQLMIYAKDLVDKHLPSEVVLHIFQPNANEGDPVRSHPMSLREFNKKFDAIETAMDKSVTYFGKPYRAMEADLVAGDHCSWCDALGVCPVARKHAQAVSKESFAPAKKGTALEVAKARAPDPGILTPAQIGEILERLPMFERWVDQVRVRALELIKMNKPVPGFKAVAKQTRYAWEKTASPTKVAKALRLRTDQVVETKMLSPSKVKALLPAKQKEKVNKFTWRPFEVTIARDSDRRPAINSSKLSFEPVSLVEEED